jgi:hypothetical protein
MEHAIPLYYPKSRFQYYSTVATGASKAAGRSPGNVGVFDHRQVHFFAFCSGEAIFLDFPS